MKNIRLKTSRFYSRSEKQHRTRKKKAVASNGRARKGVVGKNPFAIFRSQDTFTYCSDTAAASNMRKSIIHAILLYAASWANKGVCPPPLPFFFFFFFKLRLPCFFLFRCVINKRSFIFFSSSSRRARGWKSSYISRAISVKTLLSPRHNTSLHRRERWNMYWK